MNGSNEPEEIEEMPEYSKSIYNENYNDFIRRFAIRKRLHIFVASRKVRDCIFTLSRNMNIPSGQLFEILFQKSKPDVMDKCEEIVLDMMI